MTTGGLTVNPVVPLSAHQHLTVPSGSSSQVKSEPCAEIAATVSRPSIRTGSGVLRMLLGHPELEQIVGSAVAESGHIAERPGHCEQPFGACFDGARALQLGTVGASSSTRLRSGAR